MFADFEQRLADVLGARLPPPLRGAVDVAPGRPEAQVVLSVRHAEPLEEHLRSLLRPEVVPGSTAQRRVLRLQCAVGFDVRLLGGQTRLDQLRAFDRVIYELDDPDFRTGAPLQPGDASDPGFLVQRISLSAADPPTSITLQADGFFWPTGVAGETGQKIVETRVRLSVQPLLLQPEHPRLVAGGGAVDLTVTLDSVGTLRIEDGGRVTHLPFGSVVLAVMDAGGRPGAGTLSGGTAGAGSARVIPVASGEVAFQYTPPAQAAADRLVVALDNGEGGVGLELGRFPLDVRSA